MSTFWSDLRHGARLLLRAPGFTAVAVAALAIGIGANTAIFSVVHTLLLKPLPYHDADRLAVIWEHNIPRDRKANVVSPGNFIHWREMQQTFDDMAAVSFTLQVTLSGDGLPEQLPMQLVTRAVLPAAVRADRSTPRHRGLGRHQLPAAHWPRRSYDFRRDRAAEAAGG